MFQVVDGFGHATLVVQRRPEVAVQPGQARKLAQCHDEVCLGVGELARGQRRHPEHVVCVGPLRIEPHGLGEVLHRLGAPSDLPADGAEPDVRGHVLRLQLQGRAGVRPRFLELATVVIDDAEVHVRIRVLGAIARDASRCGTASSHRPLDNSRARLLCAREVVIAQRQCVLPHAFAVAPVVDLHVAAYCQGN